MVPFIPVPLDKLQRWRTSDLGAQRPLGLDMTSVLGEPNSIEVLWVAIVGSKNLLEEDPAM